MFNHLLVNPVFSDPSLNDEVYNKLETQYLDVARKRISRYSEAYKAWMADFPTQPLPTKTSLITHIKSLETIENPHHKAMEKIESLKNQLQTGQFCEGTNEHAMYRGSYEDRQLAFVWPSEEETNIRQQEEAELLAQINK